MYPGDLIETILHVSGALVRMFHSFLFPDLSLIAQALLAWARLGAPSLVAIIAGRFILKPS